MILSTTSTQIKWDRLGSIWAALAQSFDPSKTSNECRQPSENSRISLALALGKLERNLIAGLQEYQEGSRHVPITLADRRPITPVT